MMDRDSITRTGARASGVERPYRSHGGGDQSFATSTQSEDKSGPQTPRRTGANREGRPRLKSRPWSRIGENPPYGILGGTMETSASYEARSAPSSYPTRYVAESPALMPIRTPIPHNLTAGVICMFSELVLLIFPILLVIRRSKRDE